MPTLQAIGIVAKSRSGWIVFYAGCPVIFASRLQSQVALSTTEAEYISLSMSLRDVIPIMMLLEEMKKTFKSFAPTLMSTARSSRTTLEH